MTTQKNKMESIDTEVMEYVLSSQPVTPPNSPIVIPRDAKKLKGNGPPRFRAMVFTMNNYTKDLVTVVQEVIKSGAARYCIYGEEVAKTGTPHLQGFIYWNDPKTLEAACKVIPKCAFKVSADNSRTGYAKAIAYCRKDGKVWEAGKPPASQKTKGEAGALVYAEAYDQAVMGNLEHIDRVLLVRHYAAFKAIAKDYQKRPADLSSVCGIWIWGPAGVGKSRLARRLCDNKYYPKGLTKWWDGYQSEEVVVIDDISPFHRELGDVAKLWTDRFPFVGETKGSAMMIRPKYVVFTSQFEIEEIWNDFATVQALKRRVTVVHIEDQDTNIDSITLETLQEKLNERNA